MIRRPPRSTLFPYTTLFRSHASRPHHRDPALRRPLPLAHAGLGRLLGDRLVGEDAHPEAGDRKSTRLNSSHSQISYAVFCLKKKKENTSTRHHILGITTYYC